MKSPDHNSLARLLLFALVGLTGAGCLPGYVKVKVASTTTTNAGLPFYMLLREVEAKNYLSESYNDIAPLVVQPDASVVKAIQIYPGMPVSLYVKTPSKKALAAYFLFTEPVEPWRTIFEPPVPFSAQLELEGSRIRPQLNQSTSPKPKSE